MGKIAYAHIAYKDTKQFVTVPITDVKCKKNSENSINPANDSDFNKRKVYYVKWSDCGDSCEEDHEHFGYYAAFLILLGESVEQIKTKIDEGRRLIIPNLKDCSESEELQLKPKQKTKLTTFAKATQTNKNKEILQKYNTRSFLSSRTSFVKNDLEIENELENTATIDEGSTKHENIKLKKELTNHRNQIDELQKMLLHLEEKSRIRHLTTITTADRARVHSVKRELFRKDDLQSDDENFIPHQQSDGAQGNPRGPKVLSDSRSRPLPKLIRLETANNNVKQRTGYKAEDDQCQNENSEMMEDNLGERGTSNTSRAKGSPKVISVRRSVDFDVKERIECAAEDDECRNYVRESMEANDNPQSASTLNTSRSKGKPKVISVRRVDFDVKQRIECAAGDDECRNYDGESMEANDNPQRASSSNSSCAKGKPQVMNAQRVNTDVKQRIACAAEDNECRNYDGESMEANDNPQRASSSNSSCAKGKPQVMNAQRVNTDVKQRIACAAEDNECRNYDGESMEANDNPQRASSSNSSCAKGKPQVMNAQRVNTDVKQRIACAAEDNECRNYDGESMEANDNPQRASSSNSSCAKGKPQVMSVQRVNPDLKQRTRYEAGGDQRRNDVEETMKRNNDDNNDSDGSDVPRANRRVEPRIKKRKSDRMEPTLMRKIINDIQGALRHYEEQPDIDENGREMYDVAGRKIYLGEGVEVSATAWFLIKHGKPTLFFKDMVELIWTQRRLVNRCQNLEKVTTRLVDRSPMKELTPEKKRLTYKLFSDYLVEKNYNDEDVMKWLRKVPILYTEKINYLRRKHYMDED